MRNLISAFLCILALAGVASAPTAGQTADGGYAPQYEPAQQRPSGGATNLPPWAEPAAPKSQRHATSGMERVNDPNAPVLEPPGERTVPVDGGLGFLVVAGGVYALARLRKSDDVQSE
ncbi:PID-CTERM protein-sorting domain-containing protein [Longibacter salinarum]|uniref:PID-CTERM protein-sorting domain-containing protein n=1 Tax=Longibacter salinarum TaxID=1850348 RepID=UPI003CCBBB8E